MTACRKLIFLIISSSLWDCTRTSGSGMSNGGRWGERKRKGDRKRQKDNGFYSSVLEVAKITSTVICRLYKHIVVYGGTLLQTSMGIGKKESCLVEVVFWMAMVPIDSCVWMLGP